MKHRYATRCLNKGRQAVKLMEGLSIIQELQGEDVIPGITDIVGIDLFTETDPG